MTILDDPVRPFESSPQPELVDTKPEADARAQRPEARAGDPSCSAISTSQSSGRPARRGRRSSGSHPRWVRSERDRDGRLSR